MPPTPTAQVGANVRAEMARKGVTQQQLGSHLGLAQASISARLRGRTAFNVNELATVAAFLDVPMESLLPKAEAVA